jgi:hypothetical protein
LQDAVVGDLGFRAIFVYDVSRWGRFQDIDEAAHYEYLGKSAGVPILYCAEAFCNVSSTQFSYWLRLLGLARAAISAITADISAGHRALDRAYMPV